MQIERKTSAGVLGSTSSTKGKKKKSVPDIPTKSMAENDMN
jgi:hypothetical protein